MIAALNRSVTGTSSTGPITINIMDGGMSIPSVPPAVMVPAASLTSYLDRVIVAPAIIPSIVTDAPTIPVAAANIVETNNTAIYRAPRVRDIISWTALNSRSISPACSITIPISMNSGTATSWSDNITELVCSVSKKNVKAELVPQAPNVNARNIRVKEIGNPTNIENSIAASINSPIVGLEKSNIPVPESPSVISDANGV